MIKKTIMKLNFTIRNILIGIALFIFSIVISTKISKDYYISKYKSETTGVIIEYIPKKGNGSCEIRYKYIVEGKEYYGRIRVYCRTILSESLGARVSVYYSTKNAQYSQVNLKDLDEYRKTFYFFK